MFNMILLLLLGLVVNGLNIPFELKKSKAEIRSDFNGNTAGFVDKQGVLVGTISVGTPLQDINVLLDTTSGLLWVPDSKCDCEDECNLADVCLDLCNVHCCNRKKDDDKKSLLADDGKKNGYCTNKNVFDRTKSNSFTGTGKTFSTHLGNKAFDVELVSDHLRFGPHHKPGLNAQHVQFGIAKTLPTGFEDLPYDGVLGLGHSGPNGLHAPIRQLLDQNSHSEVVTIYTYKNYQTDKTRGIITVGQMNHELCVEYDKPMIPLLSKNDWSFRLFSVVFNQTRFTNIKWTAEIDLNSPYIYVPEEIFKGLNGRMGITKNNETGQYTAPYTAAVAGLQNSQVSIGSYIITFNNYSLLKRIDNHFAEIYVRPSTDQKHAFVLGRPFFENHCAFLDYSGRIGFSRFIDN